MQLFYKNFTTIPLVFQSRPDTAQKDCCCISSPRLSSSIINLSLPRALTVQEEVTKILEALLLRPDLNKLKQEILPGAPLGSSKTNPHCDYRDRAVGERGCAAAEHILHGLSDSELRANFRKSYGILGVKVITQVKELIVKYTSSVRGYSAESVEAALKQIGKLGELREYRPWYTAYSTWLEGKGPAPNRLSFDSSYSPHANHRGLSRLFSAIGIEMPKNLSGFLLARRVNDLSILASPKPSDHSQDDGSYFVSVHEASSDKLRHCWAIATPDGECLKLPGEETLPEHLQKRRHGPQSAALLLAAGYRVDLVLILAQRIVSVENITAFATNGEITTLERKAEAPSHANGTTKSYYRGIQLFPDHPWGRAAARVYLGTGLTDADGTVVAIPCLGSITHRDTKPQFTIYAAPRHDQELYNPERPLKCVQVAALSETELRLECQRIAELAHFRCRGARKEASISARDWLEGISDRIPRIEPVQVMSHDAFSSNVSFAGIRIYTRNSLPYSTLNPGLFETQLYERRRRCLGFWPARVDKDAVAPLYAVVRPERRVEPNTEVWEQRSRLSVAPQRNPVAVIKLKDGSPAILFEGMCITGLARSLAEITQLEAYRFQTPWGVCFVAFQAWEARIECSGPLCCFKIPPRLFEPAPEAWKYRSSEVVW